MKAAVESEIIEAPAEVLTTWRVIESDLKSVGKIQTLGYSEGDEVAMTQIILNETPEA